MFNFFQEDEHTSDTAVQDDTSRDVDGSEDLEIADMDVTTASPGSSSAGQNIRSRPPARPKAKDNIKLTNEVLTSVKDHFKTPRKPDDRFDAFGKMIAFKIRELRHDQRRWAEKFINDVLFEAEGGSLDGNFSFVRQMPHEYNQYQSFSSGNVHHVNSFAENRYSPSSGSSSHYSVPTPSQSPVCIRSSTPSPLPQVNMQLGQQQSQAHHGNINTTLATYVAEYNDIS